MASKTIIMLGASALLLGCASTERRQVPQPDGAAIKATAVRLLQASNADRLQQLQLILREQSLAFETQSVPNSGRRGDTRTEGHNVLVRSSAQGAPAILVGAHFDAATLADGRLSGGMVDNAAWVAVLVHLAAVLESQPLRHPVRFVFFDLEEQGLLGSRHFASSAAKDGVVAMINADTLQGGDTLIYGPAANVEQDQLNRAMRAVCTTADFGCVEFPAFPPSDDISFRRAGVPSISLAVVPRAEAHQLWLLLNGGGQPGLERGFVPEVLRTIHTPADQPEKLDPEALAIAYRALAGLLRELDENQR
jgi:Zn-dependent M28 family amino/carboxypeptidase